MSFATTNFSFRGSFLNFAAIFAMMLLFAMSIAAQGGSSSGSGGFINPLPQTPPAPDVIIRESFGWGQQGLRPMGNSQLVNTLERAWLSDFWAEYPGNKGTRWIASTTNNTWNICGADADPFEMPSPIQITNGIFQNGCAATAISPGGSALPTALVPLPGGLNKEFEVNLDGFALSGPDDYLAIGLTNSTTTAGNFFAFGSAVLVLRMAVPDRLDQITFELRAGNLAGPLLAYGQGVGNGFHNRLKLRFNPRLKTLGGQINDIVLPSQPVNFSTPKYAGFEGTGVVDNFVIRTF